MNALNILCAQLMRDLLAIAKFLLRLPRNVEIEVENQWFNQTAVCCSDIPPACVRPPVPFSYFINVCSMTRSDLRPVQEWLLTNNRKALFEFPEYVWVFDVKMTHLLNIKVRGFQVVVMTSSGEYRNAVRNST